ncbi:uncharacterized protein [Penaeus vannamei]|uniref:uncharacterized protein n=1 Tax=Penaeus vannamei TaxID=6689 RepID=UPI00387F6DB9
MSTEDISEVPVSNEGVVFMQATSETKDGRADHVQSPARSLVPPIAFPRQFSPSPDFTPTPARTAWPVAQNQRPPLPPSGPGGATVGMSPSAFESWAVSVEDYGSICGWMPPLAASYVRLLCSGDVQQRIDARVNRQEFRLLSTTAAVDTVRSVVIGPRCVVGAWSDFFTYSQAPSDTICAYVSKCRAMAGECKFQCPKCRCSLDEYMLGKKVIMGLSDRSMKAEVLRCIPRLESVNDIILTCEVIESAEKAAGRSAVGNVASVLATQDPVMTSPSPSPDPTHIEVAASGVSRRPNDQQSLRYTGARCGCKCCRGCGDSNCRGDRQCRAFGVVCRSCGLAPVPNPHPKRQCCHIQCSDSRECGHIGIIACYSCLW